MLIYGSLKNKKKVKVHAITYDKVNVSIKTLFSESKENIDLSAKKLEHICIKQYFKKNKNYPVWNLQESGQEYPKEIFQLMNSYREFRKNKNHSLTQDNVELIKKHSFEFDYNSIYLDFANEFHHNGFSVDTSLSEPEVKKFLEKHSESFNFLAEQHINKIHQHINQKS